MTELTPHQRQAVETLDRSVVVVAGPGAGKTRVLVERVIHILQERRADLDEIVAITFTNKAANEMRDKIRRALRELALRSSSREEARRWYDLKRRLEDASISTIHGFAARLLRAHPVDAQVDPNFTILEEYTSQLLLTRAVEETVTEAVDRADPTIGRLVMSFTRQKVIRLLTDVFVSVRTLGLTLDDVERLTFRHLKTADDYRAAVEALDRAIATLTRVEGLTKKMSEAVETFRTTFEHYRVFLEETPTLEHAPVFDRALQALMAAKVRKAGRVKEAAANVEAHLRDVSLFYYDACADETLRGLLALLRRIERRYGELKAEINGLDYEDLQWKARHLLRSRPEVARAVARSIRFILVDEFQDTNGLQKEIIDLIVEARRESDVQPLTLFVVGDQKQSIYGFRGATVEVFAEVEREITARGGLRLVLETNFRSQRPLVEFFNRFFSQLMSPPEGEEADVLEALGFVSFIPSEAHRDSLSEPAIELLLEVTDDATTRDEAREAEANLIADRIAQMVRSGERLIADREAPSASGADASNTGRPTPTPSRRAVRYGDIAILFRALSDIKIYERALRHRGIPYYVLAGKGFYERQEIQDILSLLQFLENRTNEIALVAALRSPLFGLSDETLYWMRQQADLRPGSGLDPHPLLTSLLNGTSIWGITDEQRPLVERAAAVIERLLDLRNRLPLVELIREIIEATEDEALQATAYDGHQRVANLRKLMELARGFDARGPHFLGDFIRYVHQFTEMETREAEAPLESARADAVILMTVHKAKGLEFPIVIVPDLSRQFRRDAPPLAFDRMLGIGLKIPDARGRAHPSWLHEQVCEGIARREFFENQRVLFVALTRAQDYLILSAAIPAAKKKATEDDEEAVSGDAKALGSTESAVEPARSSILSGRSWLDWFQTLLGKAHPEELPSLSEWNGVKLRVTRRADIQGGAESAAAPPLIEQFPELGLGQPLPPEKLPSLSEDEQQTLALLLHRVTPTALVPSGRRTISVTRLLALARCPRQFYYEDVLGLPALDEYDQFEPTREENVLSAVVRGQIVHRFCQLYDGTESWEALLARLVSEHLEMTAVTDVAAAVEAAVTRLRPLVENYLRSDLYRTVEQILWGSRSGSVKSEYEILYRAPTVLVRGRIDKLILSEDGAATIVDFKTNRTDAAETDRLVHEYAVQMQLYALAVRHLIRPRAIRAELYFLASDERRVLPDEWLDDAETTAIVTTLTEQAALGRALTDFPARPAPERCRRCPCATFCPERV